MVKTADARLSRYLRNGMKVSVCFLFLHNPFLVFAMDSAAKAVDCGFADPSAQTISDIQGVIEYKAAIQDLFAQRKFEELDCIADAARDNKARFASGGWKLNMIYLSIEQPQGHATEPDWTSHLQALQSWVSARPRPITARVTFAVAYADYAWDARGAGYANTVTQNGWKLFQERIDKARQLWKRHLI